MDTYLELYDNNRILISENDDGGEGYNAKLEIIATAGKTYFIKLRSYNNDENGPFRIFASFE